HLHLFSSTTPPPAQPSPLSLHDALPILPRAAPRSGAARRRLPEPAGVRGELAEARTTEPVGGSGLRRRATGAPRLRRARRRSPLDRKSTRLNSSHLVISYAVFCLKKKNE